MNANKPTNVKMLAAVIGGSAVVAMGAVTMAITHDQAIPAEVASSGMTVGATRSRRRRRRRRKPAIAVPTLKAVPFGGAGS